MSSSGAVVPALRAFAKAAPQLTASTHLREGLLALCPAGGEATTLQDIIEACDAEHRRLGGDLADATEEDVRLLALFSTAAKCFLCRTWKTVDDVCVHAPSDELVIQVVRRVWLPLLADVKDKKTGTCALDDGTQRQVIDECVAALRWLSGGWGVSIASDLIDYALHHVFQDNVVEVTGVLGEENLGEMRFEAAVELAAALFQLAVEMEVAIDSRNAVEGTLEHILTEAARRADTARRGDEDGGRTTASSNICRKFIESAFRSAGEIPTRIAELDVGRMDATCRRRVLACLAPAAMNLIASGDSNTVHCSFLRDAQRTVIMRLEAYSHDDGSPDFEAYFFEMLSLDATREMLLGKPGTARVAKAGEHFSFAFEGEDITHLAEFLSRGVASDERAFRRAALAAIRHGLGVSEETGAWRFDESPWCEFAALVDALEDFAAHLVDAAWKHIDALHPRGAADLSSRARGIPYHFVISAWTRGLRHANPTVRSKTLETFHGREWGASRPDADLMRSLDLPDGERFATDTLIRAAMETPNGDEKVKDFLRAYVGGCDSRDTSGAMRRVTAVVATVSRCAATANTRGLDVGTSIVEHAARAYESACGDAWHYTHETQISSVLDTLGDCAVQLLSVARSVDPETLANRARVVFDAARILAPFACTEAFSEEPAEHLMCFFSVLRLLRVAPSEAVDGDGPASMRARAAAAAWLNPGSDPNAGSFVIFCGSAIVAYVGGDLSEPYAYNEDDPLSVAMHTLAKGIMHFARDDERKTESQSETEALLADADALARVWSFCLGDGSQTIAQCILTFLAAPFDRSRDGLRSIRNDGLCRPSKRRALLLLRAAFRLAGALERASTKDGGDKLGCSSFLVMARMSCYFFAIDNPVMEYVVLAAADLVLGNGMERTDFTDERYDRFAVAAVGWSEAVFRWAPSIGKTLIEDSTEDLHAKLMSLGTQVMRSLSNHAIKAASGISARRRGDLALALASAARGVASLSSMLGEELEPENRNVIAAVQAAICLVRIEQSLVALGKDTNASPEDSAFATSAAWTATTAVLALESPANLIKALEKTKKKAPYDIGYDAPSALLRRAVEFLPAAARLGADATATTFRAVASLVTLVAANPNELSQLATASSSIFEASYDFLFRSTKFRKNAPVWAAAASAALHPAFFDASPADQDEIHASVSVSTKSFCVGFVGGAVALSRKSGGARVARVVAQALAERLVRNPERAEAYARDIFELGLAGEGEQTRGISQYLALDAHREQGREMRNLAASTDVPARVAALVLAHYLAVSKVPPERLVADEAVAYLSASRRGALAILRVALDAVSGADEELARETYRRGSPTHRRKVRAWQMLCACAPALSTGVLTLGLKRVDFAEQERLALISKLIASAPACLSRRELPGVRYYAETFHCLAATHAPALVEKCALPALAEPDTKPFVAASWIVVAASFVLRRHSAKVGATRNADDARLLTDARRVFASVFPWSMAHNHTLRVFAQAATRDLLEAFSPSAFAKSFGEVSGASREEKARDETETETETETGTETETANGFGGVGEDVLETTLRVLTTNEEMRKTRDACGDLFTQNLDASPRALLRGALDIEPRDRASETETETGTETETDGVAFEGAPVSAIDRVDAFLQRARSEIRSERERAEATLWRDAMRGGHDAREKVTGVVGDDAAASDDAAESQKNTKGSASDFLQKKVVGGETRSSSPSPSNAPSGFFPVPSALGHHARDGDDTVSVPNDERETFGGETEKPDEKAGLDSTRDESPGLVVVASLVEKIPNLAGLARTCEVLGAERLVLADLGVTKHKDFTSVSVTAEKWLRLDECPIFGLKEYLSRLKREGYALVGLEQTRGAEDVEAHAWHRKTALVLGREREGVDADILGMLDACVVIRQRGMIRSLNVHVSASMAVSRYAAAASRNGW